MNGIYWETSMPRLFEREDIDDNFKIQVISDITDDSFGSVPINLGDQNIENPVYGVDRKNFEKKAAFLTENIDVIAVSNLPNELPRDASRYFGEQLLKFVLPELIKGGNEMTERAIMLKEGKLTEHFSYLSDYTKH